MQHPIKRNLQKKIKSNEVEKLKKYFQFAVLFTIGRKLTVLDKT